LSPACWWHFAPALGGYVVALWLCGIIVNLLLGAGYYDIALRDFGLLLGALALARLSALFERSQSNPPLDYVRAISE
jgi:hypothetical protein